VAAIELSELLINVCMGENMKTIKTFHFIRPAMFTMIVFICSLLLSFKAVEAPRMDKDELRKLLDNPDVIILDVRTLSQWDQSDYMIKGAKRVDNFDSVDWEKAYPKDKTFVLYCS
jgi:hypothetical protein